jgi:hypothetical protein
LVNTDNKTTQWVQAVSVKVASDILLGIKLDNRQLLRIR